MAIRIDPREQLSVKISYSNKKSLKLFIWTKGLRGKPTMESFKNIKTKEAAEEVAGRRNPENVVAAIWIDKDNESIVII